MAPLSERDRTAATDVLPDPAGARRLVVKVGSALLVDPDRGLLRDSWMASLAEDIAWLRECGADVAVVSSGSIALGRHVLGLPPGELSLERAQAAAAVGQIRLARAWEEALGRHGIRTGQVLVTLADTEDRRRYLNARATLATLLDMGVVPIVNENDTIATEEIRFGDNDRLAAQVAVTIGADQLVLLSDVDGLYTANPLTDREAEHIPVVPEITPQIEAMAGEGISGLSRGGMRTKIMAARTATAAGTAMAITLGSRHNPLRALAEGARASWFLPKGDPVQARKRWIASMKPRGRLMIDAGAEAALRRGSSLLPAGVRMVEGSFGRGDPVEIVGPSGSIGVGLVRYTSEEARAIRGRRSDDIEGILGYPGRAALIHRDDMAP